MAAKSGVRVAGAVGPGSDCFVSLALLRVETIIESVQVDM